MEFQDYYQTVGVDRTATDKQIRTAFRKLARKHHPDVNPGDKSAEERFKQINEAYEVLSDPEKRKRYDQLGARWKEAEAAGRQPGDAGFGGVDGYGQAGGFRTVREEDLADLFGGESPFSDFFEQYFASERVGATGAGTSAGARRRAPRARAGADAEVEVEVTFGEAYNGATRTMSLQAPDGSTRRLETKIPAGVTDGSRIRLAGQGIAGQNSGPPGDLYLVVHVRPESRFERDGANLKVRVTAPLGVLVLGGTARVPTPDGRTLGLTIKPGTRDGTVHRLRGQGMPKRTGASERGDLLAEVHVELPTSPSLRERELLEELARLSGSPVGSTR